MEYVNTVIDDKFVYLWIYNRSAELNVFGVEEIALASMHARDLEVTKFVLI